MRTAVMTMSGMWEGKRTRSVTVETEALANEIESRLDLYRSSHLACIDDLQGMWGRDCGYAFDAYVVDFFTILDG